MKSKRLLAPILLVLMVALSQSVLADWQDYRLCRVGTACTIFGLPQTLAAPALSGVSTAAYNITIISINGGVTCTITIQNQTTVLINDAVMTNGNDNFRYFLFTPNHTGIYPTKMQCPGTTGNNTVDLTFVAERGVSRFMGFELAGPFLMLAIAALFLWGHFRHENKKRLVDLVIIHGTLVGTSVFVLLAIILAKHFVEFENAVGNAVLTRIDNLLGMIYIASLWITVAFIALVIIHFAISAVVLFKQAALEKKRLKEGEFDTEW